MNSGRPSAGRRAFTLVELIIGLALTGLVIGALIHGYVGSATRAEWTGYTLAAQSLAQQRVEQAQACKWDPDGVPPIDELVQTNFPVQTSILDVPISGTNVTYATVITTIAEVSSDPPLRSIRADCIWNFMHRRDYTNTVITYRGPDN